MATNKTSFLNMNDWVGTDPFKREEINDNFRTLDAKAMEHDDKLVQKADKLEVATLTSQLAEKATLTLQRTGIKNTLNKMIAGQTTTITCVGDSLTFGTEQIPSTAQVANPYPKLLQASLRKIYKNNNINVVNQGQPGWGTNNWVDGNPSVYQVWILDALPKADMVILMTGYNDVASGISLQTYLDQLASLVSATLKAGVDLVLLSPPYSFRKEYYGIYSVNEKLKQFSDGVRFIAESTNTMFIDVHNEMIDMFYKYNTYLPNEIFGTDCIHMVDYSVLTNIVLKNLQGNMALNVLGEQTIPLVGCLYAEVNVDQSYMYSISNSEFKWVYGGALNKASGKYFKLRLNVLKKNMSLKLIFGAANLMGNIAIYDNGVLSKTINTNSNDATYADNIFGSKATIVDNLSLGYHEILIDTANLIESDKYILLEGFSIEENKPRTLCENLEVQSTANSMLIQSVSNYIVDKQAGKKKVFRINGIFDNNTGFYTFIRNNFPAPYLLTFGSGKISIVEYNLARSNYLQANGTNTYDLTKKHEIRVECLNQNVKVFIDGVLELDYNLTLSDISSGKFALYANDSVSHNIVIDKIVCYDI